MLTRAKDGRPRRTRCAAQPPTPPSVRMVEPPSSRRQRLLTRFACDLCEQCGGKATARVTEVAGIAAAGSKASRMRDGLAAGGQVAADGRCGDRGSRWVPALDWPPSSPPSVAPYPASARQLISQR